MRTQREWQESIRPGYQVFANGGDEEFGAVRDVHDEKVIVDVARLPASLKATIAHAHDAEARGL